VTAAAVGGLRIDAADLVATAAAETTLAELDLALARERTWVALDLPGPRSQTLRDALGSGEPGPLAALFGAPRAQVFGVAFVAGGGRRVGPGRRGVY
jgi:FAD/FMN-containing dehydrogenase